MSFAPDSRYRSSHLARDDRFRDSRSSLSSQRTPSRASRTASPNRKLSTSSASAALWRSISEPRSGRSGSSGHRTYSKRNETAGIRNAEHLTRRSSQSDHRYTADDSIRGARRQNHSSESRREESRRARNHAESRRDENRRARLKAKAERAYARQYGESDRASAAQASASSARAALYKGMMGKNQKRSQRMQADGSAKAARSVAQAGMGILSGGAQKVYEGATAVVQRFSKPLAVFVVVAVIALFLYGPAQQYYNQMRDTQYLSAEFAAASAQSNTLKSEIDYLQTDEGIQDVAREELGYVMEDEVAGAVKGANLEEKEQQDALLNTRSYQVEMPQQWYAPVLDAFFGWEGNI